MGKYRLTEKAAADFARLYEYGIDRFGYEQAERYTEDLEKRFNLIAANPQLYPALDEIVEGCRRSVFGVHAIYYRQCTGYVEIIRILSREDPAKALES